MTLIDRAKNMIVTPKTEWDVVAAEPTAPADIIKGYVLPLAAAYALAGFIGTAMVMGFFGGITAIMFALVGAVVAVVMAVVGVFILAFIIDALAPTFSGQKNFTQAVKVAAYSYTPVWVFGIATIIPFLGYLLLLLGALYALYLLYLGLPRLMKSPEDKSIAYVVVVIVAAIVLSFILHMIVGMVAGMGMAARMAAGGAGAAVAYDRDSRLGKLDEYAKKMDEASKRMEAAEKSGDPQKQMEAAMGALGTALSGGKGVEPVQLDTLKPFLPDSFAGMPRKSQRSDRSGVAGLMAAKVEGTYGDESGKNVNLQITDTGGAAGLMGLAGWATLGASQESEDDNHIERMRKEGNRTVREEISKTGGTNSYTVILADRFVVEARGTGVDEKQVKSAVNGLDLGKLESLK